MAMRAACAQNHLERAIARPRAQIARVHAHSSAASFSTHRPRDQHSAPSPAAAGFAAAAAVVLLSSSLAGSAQAVGLESLDLTDSLRGLESSLPSDFKDGAVKQAAKLSEVDSSFEQSDTLKRLLEQSEANKAKNKKAIADKYCYRQAEMGVGDCGGLRFIPGMTDNGKQRTPDWLSDLLGVERAPPEDDGKLTLKKLLGDAAAQ